MRIRGSAARGLLMALVFALTPIWVMYSHGPYTDSIDLDPQPILGMGSDNY